MRSITQIETHFRDLFGEYADQVARETGCVKRQRKWTGRTLLLTFVFGWMRHRDASLESLTRVGQAVGVQVTDTAVHKRFTAELATFLHHMLEQVRQRIVQADPVPTRLLRRFTAVLVEDSSTVSLPDALSSTWHGCGGGAGTSGAAVKLHTRLDLLTGHLRGPVLSDARLPDSHSPLREDENPEKSLIIADLAYFALSWLQQLDRTHRWFLMRLKAQTAVYTRSGHRLVLEALLPPQEGQWITYGVLIGVQARLPVRLMIVKVPQAAAHHRREQVVEDAKRKGQPVSQEQMRLADWTILVTNVPSRLLCLPDALVLLRQRWQIERLFRRWKLAGQIDEWRTAHAWRMLCELYAKLIGELLVHWLCVAGCWHDPFRSLDKASQEVHDHALALVQAIHVHHQLSGVIATIIQAMQSGCQMTTRSASLHSAHLLERGLDWPLTSWFWWQENKDSPATTC